MWPLLLLSALAPSAASDASIQLALSAPPPAVYQNITDLTGANAIKPLIETFTDEELAGAGQVTITFTRLPDVVAAMVPYVPSNYPECAGASRCVLISGTWWVDAGGWPEEHWEDIRRVMLAHEFGHVLSLERKETDRSYAQSVERVHEECLADAVTKYVLARNEWNPNTNQSYNVAYDCIGYWTNMFGEDRGPEADALAQDLLDWAVHRYDPEPLPAPSGVAVATAQATRLPSTEG